MALNQKPRFGLRIGSAFVVSYFKPRVRRKSTLATIGIPAQAFMSRRWWSFETMRSAFPSTGTFNNPVVVRVGCDRVDRLARMDDAAAGDIHNAPYHLLDGVVLPSKIGSEDPRHLPDDGGRNEKVETPSPGLPPQSRVASPRVLEGGDIDVGVEDGF
jgi:hypothetical protein